MNDSVLFIKSPPSLFSGFPHGFDEMTPINRKIEHCKTDLFYLRFLQIINVIIKHILVYHNSGEMSIFPKRIFYFKKRQNPQAVYGKIPKKHAIAFTPSRFQDFTFLPYPAYGKVAYSAQWARWRVRISLSRLLTLPSQLTSAAASIMPFPRASGHFASQRVSSRRS